jgi:hypothetical protein
MTRAASYPVEGLCVIGVVLLLAFVLSAVPI